MNNNRILIISHLSINDTNNVGKTLFSIFNKFNKKDLIQLYFNNISPNVNKCISWFKITDQDMIHSFAKCKAGSEYNYNAIENNIKINKFYVKHIGKSSLKLLTRDILWKIGLINKEALMNWIDKYNPTVIFLAPGYNCFPYRIALKIAKLRSIPIITYLMDDYYFDKKNNGVIECVRKNWLKKFISKVIKSSAVVFSCSEEMAENYGKIFRKNIQVLYTPYIGLNSFELINSSNNQTNTISKALKFFYAGSLGLGRWETLLKIGGVLNNYYPNSILYIYANEIYHDEIQKLKTCPNIIYSGFISAQELQTRISDIDVVLHVESFCSDIYTRIRYSISTKIPECLASGKIFLAIGPRGQSGIEYLKKYGASIVCDNESDIATKINEIHCLSEYSHIRETAKFLLNNNHNAAAIYDQLKRTILQISKS